MGFKRSFQQDCTSLGRKHLSPGFRPQIKHCSIINYHAHEYNQLLITIQQRRSVCLLGFCCLSSPYWILLRVRCFKYACSVFSLLCQGSHLSCSYLDLHVFKTRGNNVHYSCCQRVPFHVNTTQTRLNGGKYLTEGTAGLLLLRLLWGNDLNWVGP